MLCLSESPCEPLLWSYYGGGHSGYALCFDGQKSPFSFAKPVKYLDQYPEIDIRKSDLSSYISNTILFRKARCWKHEKEWRVLIGGPNGPFFQNVEKSPEEIHYICCLDSLRAVILGSRMEEDDRNKIKRLAEDLDSSVQIVDCSLHARKYKVVVPKH